MNSVACIIGLLLIFWITVLRRSPGERIIYAIPFYAFHLAKRQREMYRELLMNVFLFVPVGLTLPYAVEMVSVLLSKRKEGKKSSAGLQDSDKKRTRKTDKSDSVRRGSRYTDRTDQQSGNARKSKILNKLEILDGRRITGRLKIIACGILFAAAFSFCIEFLQALFALGTAEVDDVIMNTLGTMMGCCPFLVRLGGIKES